MAKLSITAFLTLDGVTQPPGAPAEDPSGSFTHGGGMFPHVDAVFGQFMSEVFARAEAFLLGRRTYEIFVAHWPRITDPADPIAAPLNTLPKFVASRTLDHASWKNSLLVRDVVAEVPNLKRQFANEIQFDGSCGLAQTLIANDLIDEYHLLTFPSVLGTGKRLFAAGAVPAALELTATRTTSKGVLIATYVRAGRPIYGSFALEN
jgi:dihydrofolate reductase